MSDSTGQRPGLSAMKATCLVRPGASSTLSRQYGSQPSSRSWSTRKTCPPTCICCACAVLLTKASDTAAPRFTVNSGLPVMPSGPWPSPRPSPWPLRVQAEVPGTAAMTRSRFSARSSGMRVGSSGFSGSLTTAPRAGTASPAASSTSSGWSGTPSPRSTSDAAPVAGMSAITSKRDPGPIGSMPRAGSNSSLGWPSMATTVALAPVTATTAMRASQALNSRTRRRDPGRSVRRAGAGAELTVRSAPRPPSPEPSVLAPSLAAPSLAAAKLLICPPASSAQSSSTTSRSSSTGGGRGSSTIRAP